MDAVKIRKPPKKKGKPVKTHAKEKQIVKKQTEKNKSEKTTKNNKNNKNKKPLAKRTLLSESCRCNRFLLLIMPQVLVI